MSFFEKIKTKLPEDRRTRIILVIFLVISIIGAITGFFFVRNLVTSMTIVDLPGVPINESVSGNQPGNKPTSIVPEANVPMPEPWDGISRVNILVMGLDYRDWEAGEIPRTDTMILFTLDPLNSTAGIVSIPRDLWVSIPGFEYAKINTAYYLGEAYKIPGGGAQLAQRTVEELLGVPIHYYAQVDFQAFISFIDHIGGVTIDVPEEIVIDPLGKHNTIILPPGTVTLPGDQALAYARARSTEGGDFDRANRQQQIILAVRDRILKFDMMPKLVANANRIYADLSAGINTNLSLEQVIRLALKALEVPREEINHVIIGNEYVSLAKSSDGLDILKPLPDKIRLLRDEVFSDGIAVGPSSVTDNLLELAQLENASISVRNASSVGGLASTTAEYFRSLGLNVVEETNADYTVYSQIFLYGSKPYTLRYLSEMISISSTRIFNRYDPNAQFEIIVLLGDDWVSNNPMP